MSKKVIEKDVFTLMQLPKNRRVVSTLYGCRPVSRSTLNMPTKKLKRRARFAPQLLADGLTNGIVSDQGNIMKGVFDENGSTKVDPMCDLSSDKFMNMQKEIDISMGVIDGYYSEPDTPDVE